MSPTCRADGSRLDLFAWLTLASSDETSFADADTQARRRPAQPRGRRASSARAARSTCTAGRRARPATSRCDNGAGCRRDAAAGRTRQAYRGATARTSRRTSPLSRSSAHPHLAAAGRARRFQALPYSRAGHASPPAARSRSPCSSARRPVHDCLSPVAARTSWGGAARPTGSCTRNRAADGLGLPLPGGRLALFARRAGRPILIGEGDVDDQAVGEEVEIEARPRRRGCAPPDRPISRRGRRRDELIVTNGLAHPVRYEAEFADDGEPSPAGGVRLGRRGRPGWDGDRARPRPRDAALPAHDRDRTRGR